MNISYIDTIRKLLKKDKTLVATIVLNNCIEYETRVIKLSKHEHIVIDVLKKEDVVVIPVKNIHHIRIKIQKKGKRIGFSAEQVRNKLK